MNDIKYALRALWKSPGFTCIAIVTLALGIGLNTAMFSLMNTMFVRPLPFQDASSLVRIFRITSGESGGDLSAGDFLDLRSSESNIGEFASFWDETTTLSENGQAPELERSFQVSANFFEVLKIQPEIGRGFAPQDGAAGSAGVIVISDALWKSRYGSSPDVIGREVRLGSESYSIVGVLPAWSDDGRVIRDIGLFRPQRLAPADRTSRSDPWMRVIGRIKDGVTLAQARAFISTIGERVARANVKADGTATWGLHELKGGTGNQSGRIVVAILIGLSACVLLIACSNLANFVLARAIERSQELSVRAAMGASLFQLIRPLAIEASILSVAGGLGALLVNSWCSKWISAQAIASGDSAIHFPVDWRVLTVAGLTTAATALIFGTAPGLLIARMNVNWSLKSGMRGSTAGTGHKRMRSMLIVAQFAMAMMLLAGATYLIRGANSLLARNLGWDSTDVALGQVNLPKAKYDSAEKILTFQRELGERARAIPGVDSFAVAYAFPYGGGMGTGKYQVDGRPAATKDQEVSAAYDGISEDYFRVSGGRIISGRPFTEADNSTSARVAIISDAMARVLFPDGNAIGHQIRRSDAEKPEWSQIIGIAADSRTAAFYKQPFVFQVYYPISREPWQFSTFAIRAKPGALKSVLAELRPAVASIDPDLSVENLMTGDRMVERTSFDVGMLKQMLSAFAVLGLFLAAIGIYGVIARTVVQRTSEIGIRIALGATTGNVKRLVLASGLQLALVGSVFGLIGGIAISKLLASLMPGLPSAALPIVAESASVLAVVALLACYIPARAASRVNPVDAMRGE